MKIRNTNRDRAKKLSKKECAAAAVCFTKANAVHNKSVFGFDIPESIQTSFDFKL